MQAQEYEHEDVRELVWDLAEVLDQPEPYGMTVFWHGDGPYVGVRADHLRSLIEAVPDADEP